VKTCSEYCILHFSVGDCSEEEYSVNALIVGEGKSLLAVKAVKAFPSDLTKLFCATLKTKSFSKQRNKFQNIYIFCEDAPPEISTLPSVTELFCLSCKNVLYYVLQIREALAAFFSPFSLL
jgi:hypothetical protein